MILQLNFNYYTSPLCFMSLLKYIFLQSLILLALIMTLVLQYQLLFDNILMQILNQFASQYLLHSFVQVQAWLKHHFHLHQICTNTRLHLIIVLFHDHLVDNVPQDNTTMHYLTELQKLQNHYFNHHLLNHPLPNPKFLMIPLFQIIHLSYQNLFLE